MQPTSTEQVLSRACALGGVHALRAPPFFRSHASATLWKKHKNIVVGMNQVLQVPNIRTPKPQLPREKKRRRRLKDPKGFL